MSTIPEHPFVPKQPVRNDPQHDFEPSTGDDGYEDYAHCVWCGNTQGATIHTP